MLLTIDAGNTNIVFAVFDGDNQIHVWRLNTNAESTVDQYTSLLYPLFKRANIEFTDINDVIISSVVPDANYNLDALCKTVFDSKAVFITYDLIRDFVSDDPTKPEEIGADRLVNTVAVADEYDTPAVVIDFGTATTFDVVNAQGQYCGGIIAPGANLSMKALQQAAAKLPSVKIQKIDFVKGVDTVQAIQSGIYWGYVSMIEGLIDKLSKELGNKLTVIATGGLAPLYAQAVPMIDVVDDELTLRGMLKIHKLIAQGSANIVDIKPDSKQTSSSKAGI